MLGASGHRADQDFSMITPGVGAKVYLACGATDMRKGFGGLYGEVKTVLKEDPVSGRWFVFCNGRKTTLKVFYWDGSGFWILSKRLEGGRYSWPAEGKTTAPTGRWRALGRRN